MRTDLRTKFEKVGEKYFDLILKRIEKASETDMESESLLDIGQSIQMTACILTTLTRLDREHCADCSDDSEN